ncbi:multicopper oxidase domain-containing protein [Ruegeria sp. HKCCD5849]|uniref:multicopper oxidase family protein n=1 Tax=unclassified Ruegeria TaxID=2625375 RepID=UPI0014894E61|nr:MULTISPECIES: multicopper oxidase family protein [unclassified Ruegeria]NOD45876.1 multicopper oxidase domain-containing protein [Ruegeria sp. HKCCD5849]NOD50824.1 multicopper oxidase domain-containing protein [Ruegeria sp. HKCCD5851]
MLFTRRHILKTAAAASLLPFAARAGYPMLEAREAQQRVAPDGFPDTTVWSFDGTVPGTTIRVGQGARVQRQLLNALPQPTSVHWHGIRIDNSMDGVPGLTQDVVETGRSFDYDFVVPDAGTYWYHAHNRSMEQVARGLYGPLIVEEAQTPDVDQDLILMLDDWRLDPETAQITDDFGNGHDLSHAGRLGNIVTVNGSFDPAFSVQRHQRLRLRLINASNARIYDLDIDGLSGWIVALDGMPLETPLELSGSFPLAPAQRADLIVDVVTEGDTASLVSVERDGAFGLARFDVTGDAAMAQRQSVSALPPNPLPEIKNIEDAPLHRMVLQGGAMRWLESARLGETELSGQELAQLGRFWALNGRAERPEDPFLDAEIGSLHRVEFVNETAFPHAMHLHGHHFRLILGDGSLGPWRDTVLVGRGQTRQIALVADNPGGWLLHCHMLGHAASGMMSWFRVT